MREVYRSPVSNKTVDALNKTYDKPGPHFVPNTSGTCSADLHSQN